MGSQKMDLHGDLAVSVADDFIVSGRYGIQRDVWPLVVEDVSQKLRLSAEHSLLDIGCGTGLLTIPLAEQVGHVWALDNPVVLNRLKTNSGNDPKLTFVPADFLACDFADLRFDRILAYSVLHCVPDLKTAHDFVFKAASLLAPGGILLIGDIPNHDRKTRFLSTTFGKEFDKNFAAAREDAGAKTEEQLMQQTLSLAQCITTFDDESLLELVANIRKRGYDAALIPQQGERACFGWTREDLLVASWPASRES